MARDNVIGFLTIVKNVLMSSHEFHYRSLNRNARLFYLMSLEKEEQLPYPHLNQIIYGKLLACNSLYLPGRDTLHVTE